MDTSLRFRWLGTAGIELRASDQTLVIDPYLTRFPLWKVFGGQVRPDHKVIGRTIERCDEVLVTHAHFDHLMDVPDVVHNTGATALGSANSCRLLAVCGVPQERIREIRSGDRLSLGRFQVEVRSAVHLNIPGFLPGTLSSDLKPPLRARDYRMDEDFFFLIEAGGYRLLTDPGLRPEDGVAADLLFAFPGRDRGFYELLLGLVQPKVVIPCHWDDFFRPLAKPLRPSWKPPRWFFPPLQRINLGAFRQTVGCIAPTVRVFEPEILRSYDLGELL